MIFCTSFCGKEGVPGKVASGFVDELGTERGLRAAMDDGTDMVTDVDGGLEVRGGRRREPDGGEENGGKPSADTKGRDGGNPRVPISACIFQ